MHSKRSNFVIFCQSMALTLALLLPMAAAVAFLADQRQQQRALLLAAAEPGAVPVQAGAQGVYSLLLAVQAEEPDFLLLRADAPAGQVTLCAVPPQTLVQAPAGSTTLADCYLAAGPARAAQLLGDTAGVAPPAYFAATAATYAALLPEQAKIMLDTAAVFTPTQRAALDLEAGPQASLTAEQAQALLTAARAACGPLPALRAQLWTAFLRQNPTALAGLAEAAKENSARTLTDLDAQTLHGLEQTLAYLAQKPDLVIEYDLLPTTAATGGEALTDQAVARAAALLG